MGGRDDTLLAAFDRLAALEPAARERELALLALDPDTERTLRDLLAADGDDDQGLRDALEQAARRLQDDVVPPTAAGARIGPWRVLREIGSGGMGTVFLAERADGAFAQQVAIKLLRGFPTEDGKRRLRREREILAALDHPHIARLLDGGETPDGQPYLVMEYVDGVPLTEWLAGAPARDARLALFDALCAAVAHAHRQLVVHRDLKPGNVLVRADGTPKLLDFGVARLADLDGGTESTRVASAGWASPEQRAGGAITTASDVYSLGVLLRVLLGGRNDLDEAHAMPLADAELRGVVAMATAADPGARYPGVEALREDLVRWREGRPLKAARDSGWYRARKFVRRRRVPLLATAAVLALLGVFIHQVVAQRDRALEAEAAATVAREASERALAGNARVIGFLANVFAGAGGLGDDGRPIAAMALVERAEQRLEDSVFDTPLERAEIEAAIVSAYMNALRFDDAVRVAERMVEHDAGNPNPVIGAFRWRLLARNLVDAGRHHEAIEAVATGERRLEGLPMVGDAIGARAQLYITRLQALRALGRDEEADTVTDEAIIFVRRHQPPAVQASMVLSMAALRAELAQDAANHVALRREALAILRRQTTFVTDIATQQINLARALRLVGDFDAAKAELDTAEAALATDLGDRPTYARWLAALERANLGLDRGDFDAASGAWDNAMLQGRRLAVQVAKDFDAMLIDARLAAAQGRHAEAEVGFERAAALANGTRGLAIVENARQWAASLPPVAK
ncbi:MAG: protein kinase [Xanthomonadaceae bacterium]|jgi:serine/threonine-protein kinase|nr:protein kinase [Xanthomonadaceae bacterium]